MDEYDSSYGFETSCTSSTEKAEEEIVDPVFEEFCAMDSRDRLLNYYIGGIAKESIFEVYDKYVHKFVHHIDGVQKLLDSFKQYSRLDKVLLLDMHNEYIICGDSGPLDKGTYDLCWDVVKSTMGLAICYNYGDNFVEPISSSFESTLRFERDVDGSGCHVCIRGVNKYMAIVYLVAETINKPKNFIEHNFHCTSDALTRIMNLQAEVDAENLDSSSFEKSLNRVL